MLQRKLRKITCLGMMLVGGFGVAAPLTSAQGEADGLTGATVGIYRGDCARDLTNPLRALGALEYRKVIDLTEGPITAGAPAPLQDELARLDEDRDRDGVLDVDEDRNDNGVLDAGIDINASGALEEDEIIPSSALMISNIPGVWMLEHEIDDLSAVWDDGLVLAVHQISANERHLVACGVLGDARDEDPALVYVTLAPVAEANYRGYAKPVVDSVDGFENHLRVVMFATLLQDAGDQQSQEPTPAS